MLISSPKILYTVWVFALTITIITKYLERFKFCVRDQDTILMLFFVLSMVNSVRLINKK